MSRFAALALSLALAAAASLAASPASALPTLNATNSDSMLPTLAPGDRFLASRGHYRNHSPARGEVAVYLHPRQAGVYYVKRIVALAGDRIAVRAGRVILNGVELSEPYAMTGDPGAFYNNTAEITVPHGHVFVLGDNRANSTDSRDGGAHGLVPVENLRARVSYIVWSSDLSRIGRYVGTP